MSAEPKRQTATKGSSKKTAKAEKRPRGRPPEPVPQDKADEIVEWISSGKFLSEYCRQKNTPGRTTIHLWMEKDKDFAERVARARERGEEVLFEQNMDIVDEDPPRDNNGRVDSGYVAWQKNRIWTRLEMLKRMNPRKYGEKLDLNHAGGISVVVATGIPDDAED